MKLRVEESLTVKGNAVGLATGVRARSSTSILEVRVQRYQWRGSEDTVALGLRHQECSGTSSDSVTERRITMSSDDVHSAADDVLQHDARFNVRSSR